MSEKVKFERFEINLILTGFNNATFQYPEKNFVKRDLVSIFRGFSFDWGTQLHRDPAKCPRSTLQQGTVVNIG